MMLGVLALVFLAFKVSGLTNLVGNHVYYVTADFNNIGGLKVRAPVRMAGVRIGQVTQIDLDHKTYQAKVTMAINNADSNIPDDSSASILTEGILGANYVGVAPGYADKFLHNGSKIDNTHPALVLENLIGQLLFSVNKGSEKKS